MGKYAKVLSVVLLSAASCSLPSGAPDEKRIFSLINERLSYMEQVALYKAPRAIPVEDTEREKIVVEKSRAQAAALGLHGNGMEIFIRAQMEAAKAVQRGFLNQWAAEGLPESEAPDLKTEIRPALLETGWKIAEAIREFLGAGKFFEESMYPLFAEILDNVHLTDTDKRKLFEALRKVKVAPDFR